MVVALARRRKAKQLHRDFPREFHHRDFQTLRRHRVDHRQDQEIILVALEATEVDLEEVGTAAMVTVSEDTVCALIVRSTHVRAVQYVDVFHASVD